MGDSQWGCKESDTTERLHFDFLGRKFLILQRVSFIRLLNPIQGSKLQKTSQRLCHGFPQEFHCLGEICLGGLTFPFQSENPLQANK